MNDITANVTLGDLDVNFKLLLISYMYANLSLSILAIDHFENVNTEEAVCNGDSFEFHPLTDSPLYSLSVTLSFFYEMVRRGWDPFPDCATTKYGLQTVFLILKIQPL